MSRLVVTTSSSSSNTRDFSSAPTVNAQLKDLSDTYNATLAAVAELPESAAYRVNVEKITRHRLGVVEGTEDVEELENKLGLGRIEEVMEQAQDELDLIPHMARWEPWKVAEGKPPVKIELID